MGRLSGIFVLKLRVSYFFFRHTIINGQRLNQELMLEKTKMSGKHWIAARYSFIKEFFVTLPLGLLHEMDER